MSGLKTHRWSVAAAVSSFAGLALITTAAPAAAAVPAPAPRVVTGNITTCAQAGLSGTILLSSDNPNGPAGSGTVSGNGLLLDVTINTGFTASGIAVKGGPDANVYGGPFVGPITVDDMRAPQNPGGQQPQISHWFVCGAPSTPSPSTPASITPAPSGAAKTGGGGSQGGTIIAGLGALTVAGVGGLGLLWIRRRNGVVQ